MKEPSLTNLTLAAASRPAKIATAAIALVLMASAVSHANNQIDPALYPETIVVMAESKETVTKDLGTTYTHKPKTNILGRPETDIVGRPTGGVRNNR
jgi:hypothetical protein